MIRLYAIAALALWGAATDADAGAWTLPRGEFWGKLTYFRHSTEEWYLGKGRFGMPGARVRYNLTCKLMLIGKCEILRGDPAVVFAGSKPIASALPI